MRTIIYLFVDVLTGKPVRVGDGLSYLPDGWREMTTTQIAEALGSDWVLDDEPKPPSMRPNEFIVVFVRRNG